MEMMRLLIVRFRAARNQEIKSDNGTIIIETHNTCTVDDGRCFVMLLGARMQIASPLSTDDKNRIIIPTPEVRELERSLELAVNAFAVSERSSRSITSPTPSVAFRTDERSEIEWLEAREGVGQFEFGPMTNGSPIDSTILSQLMQERPDGVSLLAEALAHQHATGKFHELFRVFERAFQTDCEKLSMPLFKFLPPFMGYTIDEIKNWINVRGPATHADRRPTFAMELDTRPLIPRMEQATYDVLINKVKWRDKNHDRRELWRPLGYSTNAQNAYTVLASSTTNINIVLIDEAGVYFRDLILNGIRPPEGWWWKVRDGFDARHPQGNE